MATINLDSFFSAARTGDITTLKKYLDNGVDIHSCDDLALKSARETGQTEAVIFLLENGANLYVLDDDSILRYSSLRGDSYSFNQTLKNGNCSQEAKLYSMYNAIFCGHDEIAKSLLDDGTLLTENDGAILRVLKFCKHNKILALFKDYLR